MAALFLSLYGGFVLTSFIKLFFYWKSESGWFVKIFFTILSLAFLAYLGLGVLLAVFMGTDDC